MKEIKIYSSAHCFKCKMVKKRLEQLGIPYTNKDTGEEENLEFLRKANALSLPVVVCEEMIEVTPDNTKLDEILAYAKEA
jgi:arsenate reductase-like glutaredoxin family protein